MEASLGTLANLALNSPVLYFLKNEAGKDNTLIIVAAKTAFSIFIDIRELTKLWMALISNNPVAVATT